MIQLIATNEADRVCAAALIETDRRYFELAAEVQPLTFGSLAWIPEVTSLAASCVVHRVDPGDLPLIDESWLSEVERSVVGKGVPLVRVYLECCPDPLHKLFVERGYQQRVEIGFLGPKGHGELTKHVRLREVLTDADWQTKFDLHREAMDGPDGYTNQADLWVDMERRKCATGAMQTFLVMRDDEIAIGTAGAIVHPDGLLRLKNIVISPRFRRRGFGVATVQLLRQLAERDHNSRLGVFGVQDGAGSKLYRRAGLTEMTYQLEWSRLLHRSV